MDKYLKTLELDKILDMLGDLALIGKKVVGHFIAVRAGHALHQKLVDQIMFQYR